MVDRLKILEICQKANDTVQQFDLFEESIRALTSCGHDVTLCLLEKSPQVNELKKRTGAKIHEMNFEKKDFRGLGVRGLVKLYMLLKKEHFDVVITHRYKPSYLMMILSFFVPCRKVISVFHGMRQFNRAGRRWLARWAIKDNWKCIAVSKAVKSDLESVGIPEGNIEVIYNAIDAVGMQEKFYSRREARDILGLEDGDQVIGTIGRVERVKGHEFLIDAFAQLSVMNTDWKLVIIGGGTLQEGLEQKIDQYGLGGRVMITGAIPDAYRLLPAFDTFVMSSLSEGLPIAMLEAICAGLPLAGTNVGGIPELIPEKDLIAESGSSDSLAEVMERLLSLSEDRRSEYVEALRDKLANEFSMENYWESYQRIVSQGVSLNGE
ncbi:MAG: glycosyltransferase family 1 protein [Gammaproteobacteria bacterium]|nr:MAG: glycosyltransferase family 1 protein [Gammaproteobacteria bacterium]